MKADIHPEWHTDATVVCQCGNTWTTGATVPEIRTEICSNCHPFYTGEQRIVDTEGRVDTFMKRLQRRDQIRASKEAKKAAEEAPPDLELKLSKLGVEKRYLTILDENGMTTVQDLFDKLEEGGDESILSIQGLGRQLLAEMKRELRSRGYTIPGGDTSADDDETPAEDDETEDAADATETTTEAQTDVE